jgi:uncharacterized protein (TIGR00730 family)
MSEHVEQICVFCASSQQSSQIYRDHAHRMGEILASEGYRVIFGGGRIGSMGALAEGVIENSGFITGIIPEFMKDLEVHHPEVNETIWVETMRERKRLMLEKSDAIIGLPGGSGTLEELMETITLKRLGQYLNPIVMVNTNDAFSPLQELLERCISEKFMQQSHRNMWSFVDHPDKALKAVKDAPEWSDDAKSFAALK